MTTEFVIGIACTDLLYSIIMPFYISGVLKNHLSCETKNQERLRYTFRNPETHKIHRRASVVTTSLAWISRPSDKQ